MNLSINSGGVGFSCEERRNGERSEANNGPEERDLCVLELGIPAGFLPPARILDPTRKLSIQIRMGLQPVLLMSDLFLETHSASGTITQRAPPVARHYRSVHRLGQPDR
jgi:hypothetical protein